MKLRSYAAADEDAAIELWRRTWQQHYPHIDFAARLPWWRERWRNELVATASIMVAESGMGLVGLVTVDQRTGYLDQLVVAPEVWGSDVAAMLMEEARRLSPRGLDLKVNADNLRAIRFYKKQGFLDAGEETNPNSGAVIRRMSWRRR
jgi:putative acetyltransferase